METHKIIYFEYGGRMNCHYNPQQDNLTIEEFLKKLNVFRNDDDIRVDWHNRYIKLKYTGGEQIIKVYEEERQWDDAGNTSRQSYKLVKSLDVPVFQGQKIQQSTSETAIKPSKPTKKDTFHLDKHQKELSEHLDPEKSPSEILKGIKGKKKK